MRGRPEGREGSAEREAEPEQAEACGPGERTATRAAVEDCADALGEGGAAGTPGDGVRRGEARRAASGEGTVGSAEQDVGVVDRSNAASENGVVGRPLAGGGLACGGMTSRR